MRREDLEHLIRTAIIAVLFLAIGAGWVWAPVSDEVKATMFGMLVVLGPGLLDSLGLAQRQTKSRKERVGDGDGDGDS